MYQVFIDGSSSSKRKTIGVSYVVFRDKNSEPLKIFSKGFLDEQARNGIAELLGLYYFLYDICEGNISLNKNEEIIVYSDSQYVINEFTIWFRNQMMKCFFDTKNKEIIIQILWMLYILREEKYIIKLEWIRGHQRGETFEIYGNNSADLLAVDCHNCDKEINNFKDIESLIEKLKEDIENEEIFKSIRKVYLNI